MFDSLFFIVIGHDMSPGKEHIKRLRRFGPNWLRRGADELIRKFVRSHQYINI